MKASAKQPICTFCEERPAALGMRLCAQCAELADDVLEEMGIDDILENDEPDRG